MFATNVTALVNMTQAILPSMLKRNNGEGAGDIINIGSIAGREAYVGGSIYCATKPLTGEDIAEAIVFAAGRRENVVIADTLIFPNHQAAATIMHKKSA